jgi:hypothetical protein
MPLRGHGLTMGLTLARGRSVEAEKMGRGDDENSFGMLSSLETIHLSEKPCQEEKCATCPSSRQGASWINRTSKCSSLATPTAISSSPSAQWCPRRMSPSRRGEWLETNRSGVPYTVAEICGQNRTDRAVVTIVTDSRGKPNVVGGPSTMTLPLGCSRRSPALLILAKSMLVYYLCS